MSSPSSWPLPARHGAVFAITSLAIGLSLAAGLFAQPGYLLPLTAAVVLCSWHFGREGGFHSVAAGAVLADFVLLSPRFSFGFRREGVWGLIMFVAVAIVLAHMTASLRSTRDLQKSMLEGMSDALVVTDRKGSIVYMNPSAEALSGYTLDEARNQGFNGIFPLLEEGTGNSRAPFAMQVLSSGSPIQSANHTVLKSRDSTESSVEESAAPIRGSDGRISGAIVVLRNTTRRRQMQDQLTQSQKMEAIGRLAGGVAGDFNNLLTVITGYSEILTAEMAPANPLRRFAEEILGASERAAELTRQLLWFGKGTSFSAKPRDLNVMVGNMDTMLRRVLGPGIELIFLPASAPARISTDPGQLEQLLLNLAMNARDAMKSGGKFLIETSLEEVKVESPGRLPELALGHYVMLTVSDTGAGMDAETRSRLFEPFFTTKNQGQGSGLGLSIVYGIVQQHGGHITVYSQLGSGTIFEIYFPRVKDSAPAPVQPVSAPRGTETILIVDDEDAVRKLVHAVLVQRGYTVFEARDGKEALELFVKNADHIDLVLTDVVMPHMTGYELGQAVSRINPEKRILFMSGYRDSQVAGAYAHKHGFLNKPFTPEILLKHVREVLDKSAGSPGSV